MAINKLRKHHEAVRVIHRKVRLGLGLWLVLLAACSPALAPQVAATTTPLPPLATATRPSTATPVPTATHYPTHTPTPTQAPTGTRAPLPTAEPVAGFTRFTGKGMSIWLPDTYVGGNLATDLDTIIAAIRRVGAGYNSMADLIEKNRDLFALWAFDQKLGSDGFMSNVNVISQAVLSAVTLQMYTEANAQSLPAGFKVVETAYLDIGPYKASRLTITAAIQSSKIKEALYILQDGSTMWVVTYGTNEAEYDQRLPSFEKSIATFRSLQ